MFSGPATEYTLDPREKRKTTMLASCKLAGSLADERRRGLP